MDEQQRYYITTAIDYPNSRPHIGTAFEKIGADVQARFRRMEGASVHFLMGNDENTNKVTIRARELGLEPKAYVDEMASQFQDVWNALEISNSDFIQTSEERHHVGCRKFIQAVYDAGDIYKGVYAGHYCNGCESFKTEKEVAEAGGRCPNHPNAPLSWVEEENYYFRLSAYRDKLLAFYAANPDFIQPESRRNEILSLVEAELKDVAITRKGFTWGIPAPFDADQTIYVWFDALLNYVTAVGYGTDDERFARLWPADVHVIGKDITRFHCALWPAMLMSAGVALPRKVFGHGFVYRKNEETGEVEKLSKSLGNVVEPMDLIKEFSAEAFRYYFMSKCPFGGDGEFSFERFADAYNSGLANNLGNLYSRILTMCLKYFDGDLGPVGEIDLTAWRGELDLPALTETLRDRVGGFDYTTALQRIWLEVVDAANKYIQVTQPFKLAKVDKEATRVVLANLADWMRATAVLIKPFLPQTAETFYRAFDFESHQPWEAVSYASAASPVSSETHLRVTAPVVDGKPAPLFPKVDAR
ncbi:methionine--tRNA ligase [Planctomyces sp. SH-PL62]|uniref:methionine--tRNA ligase n=1 Tax=Planctomyces sp. SH-PL62 TaxID=1636152 RepID=UPI00078EF388|nr:methionine--tRNA ligase [Planctomyces sp. SH-PL62]AMV39368.1 Methionine--tRNA ligase [Planctomyces sp. SH-PL62]